MPSTSPSPLPPTLSRVAPHLHSALLLTTYATFFPTLVSSSSPGTALFSTLPAITLLQSVFCLICITPAVTPAVTPKLTSRRTHGKPHPKPTATSSSLLSTASSSSFSTLHILSNRLLPTLLSLILALPLGTIVVSFLLVVFGAPLTTHFAETVGAAAHVAVLVGLPLVVKNGVDGERWRSVVSCVGEAARGREFGGVVGAAVGAWMGAVPIPLDWDREWQKWPVTVLTGAYIGYVLGKTIGGAMPTLKAKSG